MAKALENEIIIGLAARIKVQHKDNVNMDTLHDCVYLFMNVGWTHDHVIHNLIEIFEYIKHVEEKPNHETLAELFQQNKDNLHGDFEKMFQRGFITNKRLFVGRQDAWLVAAKANQLQRRPTDLAMAIGNNLYSDCLSSHRSDLLPQYKTGIKQVDSFKQFDCVVLNRLHALKSITSTDDRHNLTKCDTSIYTPHINNLIEGMLK